MKKETKREVVRLWPLTLESLVLLVFPGEFLPTFVPISAIENFAEQRYQICSISTNMLASKCNRPLCYP